MDYTPQFQHLEELTKQSNDANERRYLDLVEHFKHLPAPVAPTYEGELRIPFIGTVKLTLTPKA